MKVIILEATENPIEVISVAAGTSYGKKEESFKRVKTCYANGHMSVFEFANVVFRVEGISRACSHQLVRHRLASFCQLSQRYTKIDTRKKDWYMVPPDFKTYTDYNEVFGAKPRGFFDSCMKAYAKNYEDVLEAGMKPEDARYLLPEATKTTVTVGMNARELFHFLDLRGDKAAQWEIRTLADLIEWECKEINGNWKNLMEMRETE